jgi:hypothetical protein
MAVFSSIVTVTTSPTLLNVGGYNVQDIKSVVIRNDSGVDVFLGGPTVTTGSGLRLPTASSLILDLGPLDAIYGIVAASTQPVQVLATRT